MSEIAVWRCPPFLASGQWISPIRRGFHISLGVRYYARSFAQSSKSALKSLVTIHHEVHHYVLLWPRSMTSTSWRVIMFLLMSVRHPYVDHEGQNEVHRDCLKRRFKMKFWVMFKVFLEISTFVRPWSSHSGVQLWRSAKWRLSTMKK